MEVEGGGIERGGRGRRKKEGCGDSGRPPALDADWKFIFICNEKYVQIIFVSPILFLCEGEGEG